MAARARSAESSDPRQRLGLDGERLAEAHLGRQGMRIVERRFRWHRTEIDLIAWDGATLVFVEVKTRTGHRAGDPVEAVTTAKQARIARTAAAYLKRCFRDPPPCRFDVVGVLCPDGEAPRIRHLRDAFRLAGSC